MTEEIHTFEQSLAWGERASDEPFWDAVYQKAFPDLVGWKRNVRGNQGQYLGIDRWVLLSSGKVLTIDEKKRSREYGDIALEYIGNTTRGTPGWMDKDLQIDFLAYAFLGSKRCYLFPWTVLRRVWLHFRRDWRGFAERGEHGFSIISTKNPGYLTLSVAVPIPVLLREVKNASIIDLNSGGRP